MGRLVFLGWLLTWAVACLAGQDPSLDPAFSRVPFEQWLLQGDQARIRWTTRISDAELSAHQRLAVRVSVEVDGNELAKRRGKGTLLVFVQINDEKGHVWQNHQEMDLEKIEEGIKSSDALFSQQFFVLPGDYRVSTAIYDDATEEHSAIRRKLRVSPLKNDPLPEAWRGLPAVEFVTPEMPPDSWYLPTIEGKVQLAVTPREPVEINLLVNLTPSERFSGSRRVQNRNFGALLPASKVLAQVEWGAEAEFNLALLDLSRRRVTYQQEGARELDWQQARSALSEVNPGMIDVKSLENRKYSAEFFLDEVRKRIAVDTAAGPRKSRALIVLSSPVQFEPGQEMHPMNPGDLPDARIFYIRYQPFLPVYLGPGRQRGRMPNGGFSQGGMLAQFDELEPLLKPLEPRLFDVATPEQFRRALATILTEIGKL